MNVLRLLPWAAALPCFGQSLRIEQVVLPDVVNSRTLPPVVFERGFYPAHAPAGVYTQQQLDAALAGLAPMQTAILSSETEHRYAGELLVSTTTVVDPNGALHGTDFTGDPFDTTTWMAAGTQDVVVGIHTQARRDVTSRDVVQREYVRKPRTSGATVDVHVWTATEPTDIVTAVQPVLRYTPATVPSFIPGEMVDSALTGAAPGQTVPLATGYGVLALGEGEGATRETVFSYGAAFGRDYIGDPDDYLTWIAIGSSSIQVSAHVLTESGRRHLDQRASYQIVVPDGTGEVIRNPEFTVEREVTDTTRSWKKTYFTPTTVPAEVNSADASVLAAKLGPGSAGMALHTTVDVPGATARTTTRSIDARGAVHGVDYSGNPADPQTWMALTTADIVADRIETVELATESAATHTVHVVYRNSSGPGQLRVVENTVIGREILSVTRRYLDRPLDPAGELPEGLTAADIGRALAWAEPGETVVVGQTRVRTLLSTTTTPLPDITDTNGWTLGVDFTGTPGDPATWQATGAADVYIDIYHPQLRSRGYLEVVTNHLLTAPTPRSGSAPSVTILGTDSTPAPVLHATWDPPYGMEFEVETSPDLITFTPHPGRYKADGTPLRHSGFFAPSQRTGFLRVKRR